jgi:PhnB protein
MSAKAIPEGHHTVTPYLCIKGAASALEFYKKAFEATELMRRVGDSVIMLSDEFPEIGARSPQAIGGSPVTIHLYVEDVDTVFKQAVAAGAKVKRPVADQFYGDRMGGVEDPFGYTWWIATHKEDLSSEEIQKRAAAAR